EEENEIAEVGVEAEVLVGAVAPRGRRAETHADVADLAEELAVLALRYRHSKMRADAPDDEARLVVGVFLDREAAQQHEASSLLDLAGDPREPPGHERERKVLPPHLVKREPAALDVMHRRFELSHLAGRERLDPIGRLR